MIEATVPLGAPELALPLFGARDQHLHRIRQAFDVDVTHRDGEIRVAGDEQSVSKATEVLEQLKDLVERRGSVDGDDFTRILHEIQGISATSGVSSFDILTTGKQIKPRTAGQAAYVRGIREHDLTFAIGPAGSGKTYLAVAAAVESLKQQQVRRIVLVRPAVEAGESLGFLPGDLHAKINPYLRPLFDALHEMIDYDQMKRLMEQDVIEVAPLAYMRGRTLNEAFVILDEAQNTTVSQMKMFLTRMGEGAKIIVSGDITQVDLPSNARSGLTDALRRLRSIKGVCEIRLTRADIVRHRLVQEIVQAYDVDESPSRGKRKARR
ncbi:MAG: PhoH family protein [Pirellulaceae bacterium]|jgi:phosphate starvation-inducible PhoH-like protein|nr:PhoH family protein [Pirellulaceae bacterium]MDP7016333.1 PhoH family protein [Pirellulaceae bacterium]